MICKITKDNKLNTTIDLNIDSFVFEGKNFEKGDTIEVKNLKTTFILESFQLVIAGHEHLNNSATFMLMGKKTGICMEFATLIKKKI